MCFDDNGLPTEKYTEKKYGITPGKHPDNFDELCKNEAKVTIKEQIQQFKALGISFDSNIAYRTINKISQKITQTNFLELRDNGLIHRTFEPQLFCIGCQTGLAQADLEQLEKRSTLYSIKFPIQHASGEKSFLIIATTRPEFLPACSAVFYHPQDDRYNKLNLEISSPWNGKQLRFLADKTVDPEFGTGLMMCCTFGNRRDIILYRTHNLPLIEILNRDGTMNRSTGILAGLTISKARNRMISFLGGQNLLQDSSSIIHSTAICDRCKTPIEILMTRQWSIDILSMSEKLLSASNQIQWTPQYMEKRLINWIRGLKWNWIISRQRKYGTPIPIWYCQGCDNEILPPLAELPIDPRKDPCPINHCFKCGSDAFIPETDIFDTWMTSSLSPRILSEIYFPGEKELIFSLRPQAHDIIRTWAFYTICKFSINDKIPWKNILISGWGLGFKEKGKKASKSRGDGIDPRHLCNVYGTDAFRYWAARARPGKDQKLNENILFQGKRLLTKMYNATKITLLLYEKRKSDSVSSGKNNLLNEQRLMSKRLNNLTRKYHAFMSEYNYTDALKITEQSFWKEFCAEFIEFCKITPFSEKLGDQLIISLHTYLQLFAPFLPFITEYLSLIICQFCDSNGKYRSIHI
jgi:valyl-tRNA synthetase